MDELPRKVPFDDEKESLLSENLWQLGWFAAKNEVPVACQGPNTPSFTFIGTSLTLSCKYGKFQLYPVVKKQESHGSFDFKHKSLIRLGGDVEDTALFFFGAQNVLGEEHKAIIFNHDKREPQFVDLGLIMCYPSSAGSVDSLGIDLQGGAAEVKAFIHSIKILDDKRPSNSELVVNVESLEVLGYGRAL